MAIQSLLTRNRIGSMSASATTSSLVAGPAGKLRLTSAHLERCTNTSKTSNRLPKDVSRTSEPLWLDAPRRDLPASAASGSFNPQPLGEDDFIDGLGRPRATNVPSVSRRWQRRYSQFVLAWRLRVKRSARRQIPTLAASATTRVALNLPFDTVEHKILASWHELQVMFIA